MKCFVIKIVLFEYFVFDLSVELLEFEYGFIMVGNVFNCWMVCCMLVVGVKDMMVVEVLLLYYVSYCECKKKFVDICFVFNIEDMYVVIYVLKKLIVCGYVKSEKNGKEVFFFVIDVGCDLCLKYCEVCEYCLIEMLKDSGFINE